MPGARETETRAEHSVKRRAWSRCDPARAQPGLPHVKSWAAGRPRKDQSGRREDTQEATLTRLMPEQHLDGPQAAPPTTCVETCARCPPERRTPAEPAAAQAEDVAPSCAPVVLTPQGQLIGQ